MHGFLRMFPRLPTPRTASAAADLIAPVDI
jgi:hypothetical protein